MCFPLLWQLLYGCPLLSFLAHEQILACHQVAVLGCPATHLISVKLNVCAARRGCCVFLDIKGAQQPAQGIIDPKFLAEVPLNPIPRVPRARTKKARELNPHTPLVATQQPAGIESAGWLIVHTPDKSAPQLKEQTSRPNKGVYCVALPTQWNCNMHAGFTEHGWGHCVVTLRKVDRAATLTHCGHWRIQRATLAWLLTCQMRHRIVPRQCCLRCHE